MMDVSHPKPARNPAHSNATSDHYHNVKEFTQTRHLLQLHIQHRKLFLLK